MAQTIYYVSLDDEELEGFVNEAGQALYGWGLDDAYWRGEYMDPLLKMLGITVDYTRQNSEEAQKELKEYFGIVED
jgi:hypothetical protein